MAEYPVNTNRFDPFKNFKFRNMWDNKYVSGVSHIDALNQSSESNTHGEGLRQKSPSSQKFGHTTMERGVTHDPEVEQ